MYTQIEYAIEKAEDTTSEIKKISTDDLSNDYEYTREKLYDLIEDG